MIRAYKLLLVGLLLASAPSHDLLAEDLTVYFGADEHDTDGDGLSDSFELSSNGIFDPLLVDTNLNGLDDLSEFLFISGSASNQTGVGINNEVPQPTQDFVSATPDPGSTDGTSDYSAEETPSDGATAADSNEDSNSDDPSLLESIGNFLYSVVHDWFWSNSPVDDNAFNALEGTYQLVDPLTERLQAIQGLNENADNANTPGYTDNSSDPASYPGQNDAVEP